MNKRTRPNIKWKVDYDYVEKLSAEQKEWLDKFTDEYYRGDLKKPTIHNISTKAKRKRLTDANNAANRDIYSLPPKKIADHRKKIPDYDESHKCRVYFEKDWVNTSESPENAILEVIEIHKDLDLLLFESQKKLVS